MPRVKKYNTEEMYNAPFPKLFRELMDKYKVSQEKIGNNIGVKRQTISKYANGETIPDIYSAQKIVDYFNKTYNLSYSLEYWLGKVKTFNSENKETINLSNSSIEKLKEYQNSKILLLTLEILLSHKEFIKRLSEYLITSSLHEIIYHEKAISDFVDFEMHYNFNPYENEKYKYASLLEILPKLNKHSKKIVAKYFLSNHDILFEYIENSLIEDFNSSKSDEYILPPNEDDFYWFDEQIKKSKLSNNYLLLVREYADYQLGKKVKSDEHKRKRKK